MNLERIKKASAILALSIVMFLSGVDVLRAEERSVDYTPLVSLPGTNKAGTSTTDLNSYIPGVYKLSIGVAGVLAVLMIVFGGVEYITSESLGGKKDGKERINNAIIGLILVIGSYAILSTISPSLLSFNLNVRQVALPAIPTSTPTTGTPGTGAPATGGVWPSDEAERTSVKNTLAVNKANCLTVGQSNCTSLTGIGSTVLNGLVKLKEKCNCIVTITGGTEYWAHGNRSPVESLNNTKHKRGGDVVDISLGGGTLVFFQNSPQYKVTGPIPSPPPCSVGSERYYFAGGLYVNEQIAGNAPHFHVCF